MAFPLFPSGIGTSSCQPSKLALWQPLCLAGLIVVDDGKIKLYDELHATNNEMKKNHV
jgi:hypothetical protein